MNHRYFNAFGPGILVVLCVPSTALGQLSTFAVLGGSTVTNTNTPTIVSGNLGVSPGSAVTGFPPGMVTGGTIHAADSVAAQAQSDLTTLYNQLAGTSCNTDLTGQDLGGLVLPPGVYCFSSSAQLTGTLTLDAQGHSNAVFIFKIGSTLTTASASSVVLINNSASNCSGVSWQVGSSATLGTGTALPGSIVALTSITLNTGSSVNGRVLARNGAVTLDNSNVTVCGGSPGLAPPMITKIFGGANIPLNGATSLSFTITNPNFGATLTGVGFTDTLPAGLVVATPNGLTGSCGGGAITSTAGSGGVSLLGSTLTSSALCTFSVNVNGTTLGLKNNITGNVTSNEAGPGGTASASITVLTPSAPSGVPAMSLSALAGLGLLLAGLGSVLARKRQAP